MARVFISYKRTVEPDEPIAKRLYQALSAQHEVFIDQTMLVGTRWAEQIELQLRQTDVLIVLLSAHSVGSEMVVQEVSLAHELYKSTGNKPRILPVRLAYEQPFQYPLSAYLAAINWASWQGEADTAGLIDELGRAIAGETLSKSKLAQREPTAETTSSIPKPTPAAQPNRPSGKPRSLDLPEGTMAVESDFYVARDEDGLALETILRPGATITIKGPRQMGKSSLLNRVMAQAVEAGKQVAFLDFQLFDREALQNADAFYQQFCYWLTDELEIEDCFEEYWSKPLGSTQRCTRYVGRHILKSLDGPLVLAMDEVERMFDTPFRNDFFSMLRSWHNQRATKKLWKNLDLALVTSTEPYQLIDDLNQSPFNVGQVLRLEDFDASQVHGLNVSHGEPLTAKEEQQLMALVNGHPYLVRKALYLVASGQMTAAALFAAAGEEKGPFGDHLRYHLFRVYGKKELVKGFLRILKDQSCPDEVIYFRLHGAGLVSREGALVVPRCQLYASFFGEHLG
ncbi:MAG: AAA-like domain-containing protein [Cyanobacteria bacterium J06634_5]